MHVLLYHCYMYLCMMQNECMFYFTTLTCYNVLILIYLNTWHVKFWQALRNLSAVSTQLRRCRGLGSNTREAVSW